MFERLHRDEEVRSLVSLGLVHAVGISGNFAAPEWDEELQTSVEELRRRLGGKAAGDIPALRPARELYHALGIDPTRHRPSPEALLRRLLRGDPFPRIHPAVDLANLWAVLSGLPVGLYDLEKTAGEQIVLRRGLAGESYPGISKPEVHLEGRLVLADALGPFGNPTADSARTAVGASTTCLLAVMFAPARFDIDRLDGWAAWLRERAPAYLGGRAFSALLP